MNSSVDLPAVTRPMRKLQNSMPLQSSVGEKSHRRRFFRPAAALGSPCEVRHFYQMYPPSSASPSSSSSSSASSPLSSFSSSSSHPTPLPPSPEYSATSSGTKKRIILAILPKNCCLRAAFLMLRPSKFVQYKKNQHFKYWLIWLCR